RNLGRRDRGFIAEAVFACLRRLRWYTHLAGSRDARRLFLLAAMRLPAAEQRSLEPAASADERGGLAAAARARAGTMPLGVRAELPDWVIEALRPDTPEDEILQLGRGMQAAAPLDLRVNPLLASRQQVMAALHASGIEAEPTPYSPLGLRLEAKPALEQHP